MAAHPLLNIAVRAARRAGDIIVRSLNRMSSIQVDAKAHNELVTEVDRAAENEIIETIRKSYPDHSFLGEETGSHGHSDLQWIIDPLDGTLPFIESAPGYSVSVALVSRLR